MQFAKKEICSPSSELALGLWELRTPIVVALPLHGWRWRQWLWQGGGRQWLWQGGRRRMVVTTTRRMRRMTTRVHLWLHFCGITITAFQHVTCIEVLWRLQLISPGYYKKDNKRLQKKNFTDLYLAWREDLSKGFIANAILMRRSHASMP